MRKAHKILARKPERKIPLRPHGRYDDNIKWTLEVADCGAVDWTRSGQELLQTK
jgi:hypothetical protein